MRFSSDNYWDLLAAVAGILFTLAFAPFAYAYLALPALALLFASWQNSTPRRALFRGYLFGFCAFGLGASWVYISIHDFGGASICLGIWIATSIIIFLMSKIIRRPLKMNSLMNYCVEKLTCFFIAKGESDIGRLK